MKYRRTNLALSALFTSTSIGLISISSPYAAAQAAQSPTLPPEPRNEQSIQLDKEGTEPNIISKDQQDRQVDGTAASTETHAIAADSVNPSQSTDKQELIVVTGSHIRGGVAAGANVEVFTRQDLDRSGYPTIQQFIHALPQNFQGGGGSEDISEGILARSNQMAGSSINLRGLGADSTLVLVNGRRSPQSGLEGNFNDISLIPQSAIERIEILTDGASAIYGSDAVGGVVNFILRKDYSGAETILRYGRATEGDSDEYKFAQSFGTAWSSGRALISYEFYYRDPIFYRERKFASTADLTSRGGSDFRYIYSPNPGNILDPLTFQPAYGLPEGQNGSFLTIQDLQQPNIGDRSPNDTMLPRQKRHSIYVSGEQTFAESITAFAELRFSERKSRASISAFSTVVAVPDSNPFFIDPFGMGVVYVDYNFTPELGQSIINSRIQSGSITGGIQLDISEWNWVSYINFGQEKSRQQYKVLDYDAIAAAAADSNIDTVLNVFGHGKVNNPQALMSLLSSNIEKPNSTVFIANSVLDGPLVRILDRDLKFAVGVDYRAEKFKTILHTDRVPVTQGRFDRKIYAAFTELQVPVIQPSDNNELIYYFNLSMAGRIDKYSDAGTTENPKIGLSLSPLPGFILNATYGTSFRAPNLTEKSTTYNFVLIQRLPDRSSPIQQTQSLYLVGNDPDMESEKATTWTVGASLEPQTIPELRITATYYQTKFKNRINGPTDPYDLLNQEQFYPDLVIRNPTAAQLSTLCSSPLFRGDLSQCTPDFVKAIVDARIQNMAINIVRGIDLSANYSIKLGNIGLFTGVAATYIIDSIHQQTAESPRIDKVNTVANPVDLRLRGYVTLGNNGLYATANLNFTDSYKNDRSVLRASINSYTTLDFNITATLDSHLRLREDGQFSVSLNITNVFNTSPPFVDNFYGYDGDNADPYGRFVSLDAKIKW